MKLLSISLFWILAMLPLQAEDQPSAWVTTAKRAQAQLKEGRLAEASETARQALQLAKRSGATDPKVASTYHLLGLIQREWGHCAEARSDYAHAIAIWKRQSDPNPRYIFNAVTNMLGLLSECDDFKAAEKAFRVYGPDLHRYRASLLDDARIISIRAMMARGRNEWTRAEELFRESIDMMEKAGAYPIDIASERSNLAVVVSKLSRQAESLAESERAIAFFEQTAPRHPTFIASLNNAACSLASLGRRDESERMFERALSAARDLYGEDNRITAKIMLSYARVLRENKERPAAEVYQKRGSEAFRRSLVRDNGTIDAEELKAIGK